MSKKFVTISTGYRDFISPSTFMLLLKIAIVWNIAPCSPYMNRRFGGMYRLHIQGPKSVEQEINVRAGGQAEWAAVMLVSCSVDFGPWRGRRCVPPKRRFIYGLRGAISQKMAIFITTSAKTSNTLLCLLSLSSITKENYVEPQGT
jgi:hypothetical protein